MEAPDCGCLSISLRSKATRSGSSSPSLLLFNSSRSAASSSLASGSRTRLFVTLTGGCVSFLGVHRAFVYCSRLWGQGEPPASKSILPVQRHPRIPSFLLAQRASPSSPPWGKSLTPTIATLEERQSGTASTETCNSNRLHMRFPI
jgi:hypothetical protein